MTLRSIPPPASLLLVLLAFAPPAPLEAQGTPQELADQILAAIAAQDDAAIRALLHPESVSFAGEERVGRVVGSLFGHSRLAEGGAEGVSVQVVPASEMERYAPATRTYRLGPLRFVFSPEAAPTDFLHLDRSEANPTADGVRVTGSGILEGIVRSGDMWYVTVSRLER